MPYLESVPPPPSEPPAEHEPVPEPPAEHERVPEPAAVSAGPASARASATSSTVTTDLDLFVGFVGGALVGLTILELGFFRTLVIGGCGALGVLFVRRHQQLMAKLRSLL